MENLPAVIPRVTYRSEEPIKERDWPQGPSPERRCRAHKKTGERCKNAALQGSTVCRFHGGAAKHVKAAARARLDNAADLMARKLLGLAVAADSETVQLSATNSVLDRVGITKPTEVVLSQGDSKPWEEVYEDIAGGLTREESRAARGYVPNAFEAPPTQRDSPAQTTPPYQPTADQRGNAQESSREAPVRDTRRGDSGPERQAQGAVHHIQGEEALRVAGQLAREQLALESPHKRYPRP